MEFFCAKACQTHAFQRLQFSPAALRAALSTEWAGNVRQLAHAVEAAVIRAGGSGAPTIDRSHLFPERRAAAVEGAPPAELASLLTFQDATRQFQAQLVFRHLQETGWNVTQTAERLDLTGSHVYNLIKAFGLERGKDSR
jgi:Nif-specific regulatory protein